MKKRLTHPDQSSEVDMTPMLDIVFIMLIFFIVTTSFIKESGLTINRPENLKPSDQTPENPPIVIKINELEDVVFADRMITQDAVQANIEVALSTNPNAVVLVKVDETVDTGILVNVVDQIKLAGISQVTVSGI